MIKKPEQHIVKYPIKLGDEGIITSMSFFIPDLLTLHGDLAHVQKRSEGDPEDPHDEFYLKMTTREVMTISSKTWNMNSFKLDSILDAYTTVIYNVCHGFALHDLFTCIFE